MPEAGAAGAGTQMGGMDGDHRLEAGLPVGDEMHELMLVEIRIIPKRVHSGRSCPDMFFAKNGATNGI